jgi:sec-independent protein translocase protein TatC
MADIEENDPIDDKPMPLLDHLIELRRRLMWSIGAFIICFMGSYYFSSRIYFFLAEPLATVLREQGNPDPHLIYTQLYEAFFTRIKVAFFAGAFIAFPIIANQLWLFVAPGLYRSEKRAMLPFLAATPVLFLLGAALAYYFVFPFAWRFFASFQDPTGGGGVPIELLPRVSEYLDLVMKLIFAFGLTFELPVLLTLLARVGIITSRGLKRFRRYAYVGMFVIAAICAARRDHADRTGSAADRALRNLHPGGEAGGAETGRGIVFITPPPLAGGGVEEGCRSSVPPSPPPPQGEGS